MGSASRPHRRARSAKVSYKDSASGDEANENFSIAHQSIPSDRVRKNLALKRVSRSQERAEALQVQKAIEESLSQDAGDVKGTEKLFSDAVDDAKEVVDSEEEGLNIPGCVIHEASLLNQCAGSHQDTSESMSHDTGVNNQAVLDEIPLPSMEIVHGNEESLEKGIEDAMTTGDLKSLGSAGANKKTLRAVVEKDEEWSCEEDDDDDEDDDEDTDEESSDASEGLKYKRKRPVNSQKKARKAAGHMGKEQKAIAAQVKKPRSSRTVSEARTPSLSAKKGGPNGYPIKSSTQPKPWDSKGNNLSSIITEAPKKHAMDYKESNEPQRRGALLKGCKSVLVDHQRSSSTTLNKTSLLENALCESPGILNIPAQSPTGIHRRVLGLSRRFKPPPLHPYLPKMQG